MKVPQSPPKPPPCSPKGERLVTFHPPLGGQRGALGDSLIVLLGPTGVGKTALCIDIAKAYNIPIINADSRQIYRDIPIGTAAPTAEQQREVEHYFVGTLGLDQYYSASLYEENVMSLLQRLFAEHNVALLSGGSMMYIDAVCNGIDQMPTISETLRQEILSQYDAEGLEPLLRRLQQLDPEYYDIVDRKNPRRVIHALEICIQTGQTYTSFRTKDTPKSPLHVGDRDFNIIKIGLNRPREELFTRINERVLQMIDSGMIDEARRVYPLRHLNSLNTVGYKELFRYFDGGFTLDEAIARIQKNTRVYCKKQLTWFKRDESINWFHPDDKTAILNFINERLNP